MKRLSSIFLVFFLLFFPLLTKACDIILTIDGVKKEVYKPGDIVVIKITVVLKHRNCDIDINKTAVNMSGSQITGTTKWINTGGKTWERKIRIKILDDQSKKVLIKATRTCDRDGGEGSIVLAKI